MSKEIFKSDGIRSGICSVRIENQAPWASDGPRLVIKTASSGGVLLHPADALALAESILDHVKVETVVTLEMDGH